jgi:hypothetical protein
MNPSAQAWAMRSSEAIAARSKPAGRSQDPNRQGLLSCHQTTLANSSKYLIVRMIRCVFVGVTLLPSQGQRKTPYRDIVLAGLSVTLVRRYSNV